MDECKQAGPKPDPKRLEQVLAKIKNKIVILSGKGGVGKSTVSVNIAYGLAKRGYKVGILDTDLHGPNVPKMLGIEDKRLDPAPEGVDPVEVFPNLVAVSVGLLLGNPDQAVVWRGPLKMNVIRQLLADVNWGELDYLIIDSPPGTGDEPLSVCQLIPELTGAVIVTTPQDVSILDSRKSVNFARQLGVRIAGIVENMSGFICPGCKTEVNLFGKDGGKKAAAQLGVPFLGALPIEPEIVTHGDSGEPFIHFRKDSVATKKMDVIIDLLVAGSN